MIQEDPDVEILDKDVYLATVSEGGSLHIEMRVKIGRGYVPAEKNFDEDLPIGYIPVDSAHSPIRKVNYTVEAARLGQMILPPGRFSSGTEGDYLDSATS